MVEVVEELAAVREEIDTADGPGVGRLFLAFFRLGLTAFGGPAIIGQIRSLAVEQRGWLDDAAFTDGVVLSQSIPGGTVIQVATYVGLKVRGVAGAAAAFLGLVLPAFLLMLLFSQFYAASRNIPAVQSVFAGLQVVVVTIVAQAAFSFGKQIVGSFSCCGVAVACAAALSLGADPFLVIVGSALTGTVILREDSAPAAPVVAVHDGRVLPTVLVAALITPIALYLLHRSNPGLCSLSLLMLRVNFLSFGGALSALPLMHHEIVSRGWMDGQAFLDGIALGQITPGPISITGTFIGYFLFGLPGALVTSVATFAPSFLLLIVVEPYFGRLKGSPAFARASRGVACCFVGLLVFVTITFGRGINWDLLRSLLAIGALLALFKKIDLPLIVLAAGVCSMAFL